MRAKLTTKPGHNKTNVPQAKITVPENENPEYHTNTTVDQSQTTDNQKHVNKNQNNAQMISKSEAEKQTEIITNAIVSATEKISKKSQVRELLMLFINAALLITTIALFWYNKKGIDASVISFKNSDSVSKATLKQTQDNFEKDNQPYLVANQLTMPIIKDGVNVTFKYSIFNYGKQPIKLISGGNTLRFVPKRDSCLIWIKKKIFLNIFQMDIQEWRNLNRPLCLQTYILDILLEGIWFIWLGVLSI